MKISRFIKESNALVQNNVLNNVEGAIQWQLYGDEISIFVLDFVFMRELVSYIVSMCLTEVLFTLLK